jgi:glutamate-1-semialdehyde 2,1-aminomutase
MKFEKSKALQRAAHAVIPGGCHTYAKGDDQYPELAPAFLAKGKGCHVWDVDGNEYIEYGMGLRAVTLGHAYEPVVQAAYRRMLEGANFTRPSPIEVECAEKLRGLIAGAEMVKFAKNGSDANDAAVKLARAYTGRDRVAICANHPFFSVNDWFIGTTPMSAGIPQVIRDLTVKFKYNDPQSVRDLFERYPGEIACLIMEPVKTDLPADGFLHEVQRLCREHGALFVLDEMITGFRVDLGGAQKRFGIVPDMSTFGKGLGNGFAISALVGREEFMKVGGLHHDKERVFLMSTTHGAETHALAAALEVMSIYEREPVIEHMDRQGQKLITGIEQLVTTHQLGDHFGTLGLPCNLVFFTRDQDKKPSQPFRTLFLQETIARGLLAPSFVVSYSHSEEDIDRTIEIVDEALAVYASALEGGIERFLRGRPVKPVYRRFN